MSTTLQQEETWPRKGAAWLRPGATWSCREYFLIEGAIRYTLGFGTTNKTAMFELFDWIAKSFEIREVDRAAA